METPNWLTDEFEANRARVRSMAYRMLGSPSEADDVVQETWLRCARADTNAVFNFAGWLTTIASRICLDRLRARRDHSEVSFEKLTADVDLDATAVDPEQEAMLADSVGAALLVVLDQLSPAERVAFVLHDVFAVPFDDVAAIVERTPDATRQLASRARRQVQRAPVAQRVDPLQQREIVSAFLSAARNGDFEGLLALLDPNVDFRPDAASVGMGSLRPSRNREDVAKTISSGGAKGARFALVDGLAGMAWAPTGEIRGAILFTVVDGKIVAMDVIGDPKHLAELDLVLLDEQ